MDVAAAAGGGGGRRRRRRGDYLSMSCVELRGAGRGGINFCSLGGRNLVIGESHTSHHNRHVVVVLNSYVE